MHRLAACSIALGLLGLAAPSVAGQDLTAADVRQVMTRHGDEVKACYLRHGIKQRSATGKVTVTLVVERDGHTRDARVDAPGVKGKQLVRCVTDHARDWQFRETRSVTEVELPFLFQHTPTRGPDRARASR